MAAFCCAALGIVPCGAPTTGARVEILQDDNRAIVRAASQASETATFLLGFLPAEDRASSPASRDALDQATAVT